MEKNTYYRLAFKQGNIGMKDAELYIRLLSEETLDYITSNSFDRKLIKPIMRMAWKTVEEQDMPQKFGEIVNEILHNKREMFILMNTFV